MSSTPIVLLLFLGTAFAATHVNISIAQHPADVTYVDGKAPAALKAGPGDRSKQNSDFSYLREGDNNQEQSAKLRFGEQNSNFEYVNAHDGTAATRVSSGFSYDGRSARIQVGGDDNSEQQAQVEQVEQHQQQQQQDLNSRSLYGHQRTNDEYKQLKEQKKQNQEFERYIQNYHSGPTVETVYETANPAPQRYQNPSSSSTSTSSSVSFSSSSPSQRLVAIGSRPTQVHTFERQVALPAVTTTNTLLPSADTERQTHAIVNHQPKPSTEVSQQTSSSSPTSTSSVTTNINQGSAVYDQKTSFDQGTLYSKPNYDATNYNFGNDDQQTDLQNQYPPNVDEPQDGYGGTFYGNNDQSNYYGHTSSSGSGYTPNTGYLPSQQQPTYQRPVVTKTIQIAQPALRAKKYEIRHPAIQKEFYDIEERVVIKPAGTIVVELERPVAKIPRGESILPLGHPHPAVASAYNNGQSVIQTQSSSAGSISQNNQYSPSPAYNPKPLNSDHPAIASTTLGSTLTTTPSYDQSSKDDIVESKLNRQYSDASQYVTTTERNDDFFIATDARGAQHQISTKNLSPKMIGRDEPDFRYPSQVEVNNNGAVPVNPTYASNNQQNSFNYNLKSTTGQASFAPRQSPPEFLGNYNGNKPYNGDYFASEFYNNDKKTSNNQREDLSPTEFFKQRENFKPARLQQQPLKDMPQNQSPIIKHEHNIHLPPVQHNIYLSRLEQSSANEPQQYQEQSAQLRSRYNEEPARVLEIKPFLQQHKGSVVVYASTTVRPTIKFSQQDFTPAEQTQSHHQQRQYHGQFQGRLRNGDDGFNRVQYSAPYSQMRHLPQESARFTYGNAQKSFTLNYNNAARNKADLVQKDNSQVQEKTEANDKKFDDKVELPRQKTHIQIQIPHQTDEADQPIVVSSTISPSQVRTAKYRQTTSRFVIRSEPSDVDRINGDSSFQRGDQAYGVQASGNLEFKPDCDQSAVVENKPARYELAQSHYKRGPQQFLRLVESNAATSNDKIEQQPAITKLHPDDVDLNLKSSSGHVATGSRVIAATPAPTDASASKESFHKRRIVVNHPFQTVREVVEHEPITNYHNIQVNEPAMLYQPAPYFQTHGALRQDVGVPVVYHHSSAVPDVSLSYNHHHV